MLLKPFYRSELREPKLTQLLKKIREVSAAKDTRFLLKHGDKIYRGNELFSFAVDENLSTGTIEMVTRQEVPGVNAVKSSLVVQDITYEAIVGGVAGDNITIAYVDDGTAGAETVEVVGTDIIVHMEDGVSTATQIKAAFDGEPAAVALVTATITGTPGDFQAAAAETPLAGGADEIPTTYVAGTTLTFDKADIKSIFRLRTRKYRIVLHDDANPA